MTRKQLITLWCKAEGGKKAALDAPQAREAYAKLRVIIGEFAGVDLDDVIAGRGVCINMSGFAGKESHFDAFPVYVWRNGKPRGRD